MFLTFPEKQIKQCEQPRVLEFLGFTGRGGRGRPGAGPHLHHKGRPGRAPGSWPLPPAAAHPSGSPGAVGGGVSGVRPASASQQVRPRVRRRHPGVTRSPGTEGAPQTPPAPRRSGFAGSGWRHRGGGVYRGSHPASTPLCDPGEVLPLWASVSPSGLHEPGQSGPHPRGAPSTLGDPVSALSGPQFPRMSGGLVSTVACVRWGSRSDPSPTPDTRPSGRTGSFPCLSFHTCITGTKGAMGVTGGDGGAVRSGFSQTHARHALSCNSGLGPLSGSVRESPPLGSPAGSGLGARLMEEETEVQRGPMFSQGAGQDRAAAVGWRPHPPCPLPVD